MSGFFTSVASILKTVTHRHGIDLKLLEYQLHQRWLEIVGPQIAAHSRPDQIRFKKLYLIVEDSVWLQHLTFLKPALLEKIHEAVGAQAVTDIVLRVGELYDTHRSSPCDTADEAGGEPSSEVLARAAAMTASVTDPDLRARLAEVMANLMAARPRPSGAERARR
jgi:hypothetical protein